MTKLDRKVVDFIRQPLFGKLATASKKGMPHVTPIWYAYVDGKLLVNTAEGRVKLNNVRRSGKVALLVDNGYGYVLFRGRGRIASERDALKDIETMAVRYLGPKRGKKQARGTYWKQKRVTIEIIPEKVVVGF